MAGSQQNEPVKRYYEEIASKYDEDRFANSYGRYIHAQESRIMHQWLSKKGQTLSMACGTGRFMEYASHGIDISGNMIEEAISKYPDKDFFIGPQQNTHHFQMSTSIKYLPFIC